MGDMLEAFLVKIELIIMMIIIIIIIIIIINVYIAQM